MAMISLIVDGDVTVGKMGASDRCILVNLTSYTLGKSIHLKDSITIHGSHEQVRSFANALLAALPQEPTAQQKSDFTARTPVNGMVPGPGGLYTPGMHTPGEIYTCTDDEWDPGKPFENGI
jgi:hypothetical protein